LTISYSLRTNKSRIAERCRLSSTRQETGEAGKIPDVQGTQNTRQQDSATIGTSEKVSEARESRKNVLGSDLPHAMERGATHEVLESSLTT